MLFGTRLYRALLREARALPDDRARLHFKHRARSLMDRLQATQDRPAKAAAVVSRANKLLRQLQATNDGYTHAIERTLATAFGQRGPLKHKLLQPFVRPDPAVTKHNFSPPLAALVTSPLATSAQKAPTLENLTAPPTLPPRAFAHTDEARLLGQLIPQRIKAIKRRYWNTQTAKLSAPIAVNVTSKDNKPVKDVTDVLKAAGLRRVRVATGQAMLAELERKASVPEQYLPRSPRRSRTMTSSDECKRSLGTAPPQEALRIDDSDRRVFAPSLHATKWSRPSTISSRLMRRQYQRLLEQVPVVTVQDQRAATSSSASSAEPAARKPFKIAGINISVGTSNKHRGKNLPKLRDDELQWFK
ncbi:hypothetical protein ACM66B_002893 [Microbotryomycetes sp. NB124-2]